MSFPPIQTFPSLPGYRLLHYPTIDSTNSETARFLESGRGVEAHGLVVSADFQTGGRGRLAGRSWFAPSGKGLTFSVAIHLQKQFWEGRLPLFPLLVGVALLESIDQTAGSALGEGWEKRLLLKWPNDLYLDGRKLSGILIENVGEMAIVGIGVNLNVEAADFPGEVRLRATSLKMATGREWDRFRLLEVFLGCLQGKLDHWRRDPHRAWSEVLTLYRRRFYLRDRQAAYTLTGNDSVTVQVVDVTEQGALRAIFPDGHQEDILAGDLNPV